MGSSRLSYLFLAISVFQFLGAGICTELVPVYLWETTKSNEIVPAIGHVNEGTFKEILLEKVEKSNPQIVVFAEPNLSPEDFVVQDKKTFQNVAKISSTVQVSYMPLVENPVETVKDLLTKDVTVVSINEILNNELPESRVLIVNLNDAKDDEDRIDMLRRHDATIVELYSKILKQHKHVLAILTGLHSSWVVPEQAKSQRQSRHILADDTEKEEHRSFAKGDFFLMYLGSGNLVKGDKIEPFKLKESDIAYSQNETFSFVTMTTNLTIPELRFTIYNQSYGYWHFIELQYNNEFYKINKTFAPMKFSYHCHNYSISMKDMRIDFLGLQMQFGPTKNVSRFSDSYDCIGFTSAPIWSGLFISFILVLILTAGLVMMMDIKTMDRFDDPKGKTIIVNASE
ncbi:PREDICTED: V-type proton ATPase subunit S1 [Nicrophorus vespilloides]|uniref:V-type proton ATPase subunit S1 n=1 Tax=Nicrophorus vespilloides TaxID=110193 RepID=A0ABM1MYR4_NICVS|nr:PREDICTED: V-type proton ATPase subunit S1 [Nicrophorus vespilloides]